MGKFLGVFSLLAALNELFGLIVAVEEIKGPGNGTSKLETVLAKFTGFVQALANAGRLPQASAAQIIDAAPLFVSLFVNLLNTIGVFKKKDEPMTGAPASPLYGEPIRGPYPGDEAVIALGYKAGSDYVHLSDAGQPEAWLMQPANLLNVPGFHPRAKKLGLA